jgi:hypothetical protein
VPGSLCCLTATGSRRMFTLSENSHPQTSPKEQVVISPTHLTRMCSLSEQVNWRISLLLDLLLPGYSLLPLIITGLWNQFNKYIKYNIGFISQHLSAHAGTHARNLGGHGRGEELMPQNPMAWSVLLTTITSLALPRQPIIPVSAFPIWICTC